MSNPNPHYGDPSAPAFPPPPGPQYVAPTASPQAAQQHPQYLQPAAVVYAAPYTTAGPGNGLATAALTLGILSVVLFWVPFVGLVLALIGIGLGIPALLKANRIVVGRAAAIWGLSLSGVSLVLFGLTAVALA